MLKPAISCLVAILLFGAPGYCMGDYEDEFPDITPTEYEYEEAEEVEIQQAENPPPAPCQPCCRHRRWKKDRFLENQFQETGWPGRRDELSDKLSR